MREEFKILLGQSEIYDVSKCFEFEGRLFEELTDCEHRYREILAYDDYDYIEDEELINRLDRR